MEDSKIIELFSADPERAVTRLFCKYGRSCRKIAFDKNCVVSGKSRGHIWKREG